MKRSLILCLTVTLMFGWIGIGFAQQSTTPQRSKIPAEVWEKAQKDGVVRIIVQLNVPWKPEGYLDQQAVLAQRQAIVAAQDRLIVSLVGTMHRVIARFWLIPGIGLEVGVEALVVLELSPLVIGVEEDRIVKPAY